MNKKKIEIDIEKIRGLKITEFYEYIAGELGFNNDNNLSYDCRKIEISKEIQDVIYQTYQNLNPDIPKNSVNLEVTKIMLIYGPKAYEHLKSNEVIVLEGFVLNCGKLEKF